MNIQFSNSIIATQNEEKLITESHKRTSPVTSDSKIENIVQDKLAIDSHQHGSIKKARTASRHWTVKEKQCLQQAIATHGENWELVAERVKTRTPLQCKNKHKRDMIREQKIDNLIAWANKYIDTLPKKKQLLKAETEKVSTNSSQI